MKLVRAVVLLAGSFAAFSIAQNTPPGGTVEGVVINSVTGAGIGGASVALVSSQSNKYDIQSDVAGHFRIAGVAPGNYRATVRKDGFWPPPSDRNLFSFPEFRIVSGTDPVKLELKLAPFITVRGRVLGPDGKSLAGVEVAVAPNVMANEALTDAEGRFELRDTRPGSYTLIARPPASAKPVEMDGTKMAMVNTYYPSVADRSLAQQIVFGGQPDTGGYEIRIQTAPAYGVRGIVVDEAGKPSPGAEVTLVQIPAGAPEPVVLGGRAGASVFALGMQRRPSGAPEATTIAGTDGHFEFPIVRTGDWRIYAVNDSARQARGAADARVGRSDLDDLQIHVATPFNLTGTVEWKGEDNGGQRVSNAQLLFGVATLVNPEGNEFVASGVVESGGLLFENVVPGRYKAIVKPGLSAQIYLGDYEVTGQIFPVTAGSPRLRVVLKTWSGTVRGTVEKGEGATVILLPQRREGLTMGLTVACGAGGSFELSEVSPGDYYIAAFERMEGLIPIGLGPSAAMLGLVPSRGTSVRVEERSTVNVTLSVIAAPR